MNDMSDKISFISCIIPEFADAYKMSVPNAYNYLKKHGGYSIYIMNSGHYIMRILCGLSVTYTKFA
jgi:hypothetical protein